MNSIDVRIFVPLVSGAIGMIFGAGGAWAVLVRMRKDLNGVGRNLRRLEKNVTLALMVVAREDGEAHQRVVDLMRQQ